MALLVSEIFTEAAALLGDPNKTAYTDDVMLPFAKKAYGELEIELMVHKIPVSHEISAELSVAINETLMALMPTDLVEPIYMEERDYGVTTQQYVPMQRCSWEPDLIKTTSLIRWDWRESQINFVGATTRRGVRIRYRKFLAAITSAASNVPVNLAKEYMASRTGALTAFLVGEDETRGTALAEDAKVWLDKLIGIAVGNRQGLPIRRKAYRRFLGKRRI